MNEARQYEETIDLLSLMVKALRKWPVLLAAMLIGAVLLGGYKGLVPVDHTGEIKTIETQIKAIQAELDTNLDTRKANERTIEINRWTIERNKKTITQDKEQLPVLEDQLAHWKELLDSLENSLKESQDLLTDPSLTADQHAEIVVQVNALTGNILNVSARVNAAEQQIPNTETEIENLEKDIRILDNDIRNLLEKNKRLQELIDEKEEQVTELEEQIPDLPVTRASLKTVLKYAIVGAIVGAFIFCVVIFLQFILDHRLRASGELKERYNFPILGEFSSEAAKRHGKLDQWLDKLSGDVQTLPEEQQVYELIAAGVRTFAATKPLQLAVTGTVSKNILDQVGGQLKTLLPDTYEIKVESNPVYNAAFLAGLKQCTVLLVEAKGVSDKREIEKLAEVLCRNEVEVIGAVVK